MKYVAFVSCALKYMQVKKNLKAQLPKSLFTVHADFLFLYANTFQP